MKNEDPILNIQKWKKMTKKEKNINEGSSFFKPRARLLILLGEQLIKNEIIAVVELVKNAYDADATKVEVIFRDTSSDKSGKICIVDNGIGMDIETILKVWLEPATEFRKLQKKSDNPKSNLGRVRMGEKGIGRFAVHKLGRSIELVTKAGGNTEEIVVKIDWEKFETGYLEDIPISWISRKPEIFIGEKSGTSITITNLRKTWDEKSIKLLNEKLNELNSPFQEKKDFFVHLESKEFDNIIQKIPKISEILQDSIYSIQGNIDENGSFTFDYKFYNSAFAFLKREIINNTIDVRDPIIFSGKPEDIHENDIVFNDKRKPDCGPFTLKIYVWDLDHATLRDTISRSYYQQYIKPHSGIRIYRDDFRVWPYGEQDDDSFSLDFRRVNNPTLRISRNQIIGIVEILSEENPNLRDKTDREGLITNREYTDFRALIIGCISKLETERRKDKDKVDQLRLKKKPGDEVKKAIENLNEKITSQGHREIYKKYIEKIENTYDNKIKTILDPLLVTAGLGIAYTMPVHEVTRNLSDLEKSLTNLIKELEKKYHDTDFNDKILQIIQIAALTDDIVHGVGKLSRKGRPESFSLNSAVKDAISITTYRLSKDNISVEISDDEGLIKIQGLKNMIITAILNLIDNSSYWLLHKATERKIKIIVDHDTDGRPRIIVSDNGPGITDDPELLIEPFFTRKPDGSGLGLYIVDKIMKVHEGTIEFLSDKDQGNLLNGANAALVFLKEKAK